MIKTYKSYELLKAIASREIKENSKIEVVSQYGAHITTIKYENGRLTWKTGGFDTKYLCDINTEFIVVDNKINIQEIEELNIRDKNYIRQDIYEVVKNNRESIIELQKALKQLDRKIQEIKEIKEKE